MEFFKWMKKEKNVETEESKNETTESDVKIEENENELPTPESDITEPETQETVEEIQSMPEQTTENTPSNEQTEQKSESTVDDFLTSLNKYKIEQPTEDPQTKKKRTKAFWTWASLLTVCIVAVIVAFVLIGLNIYDSYASDKLNSELSNDFFSGADRTDLMAYLAPVVLEPSMPRYGLPRAVSSDTDYEIIDTNNPLHEQFKEKLIEYKKINPDIYGWIQVDGTDISYAVVRGEDNKFYLNHTATLEYNTNGAIFADFRCEDNILDNPNFVLYGHNSTYLMQMFAQITKFLDRSFFNQNRYITIYTIDGVYRYEIFAIYETYSTYSYCQMNFISENSFVNWCNTMKSNSLYPRNITDFTTSSRIITLSTCTNGYFSRRYSLQGKLVTVEK